MKLDQIGNGWHLGSGPMEWPWHFEFRIVCGKCEQAIFPLTPEDSAAHGFTWTLEQARPRVADHVLKCHAGQIADLTYR